MLLTCIFGMSGRKVDHGEKNTLIQTVRGVGYVLKEKYMKLKTKIHLFSTLLMLIILTLTNIGVYFLFEKMAYDTEYNQLRLQSDELTSSLSQMTGKNDPSSVLRAYIPPNGAVRIIHATGEVKPAVQNVIGIESFLPELTGR